MEYQVETRGEITIISIIGSIDTLTAEEVSRFLKEQMTSSGQLVIELSRVDYLSSAGLRVLLGAAKEARRQDGDLRLAAVEDHILEILEMAGFTSIMKHYPTIDAAVASYDS